jgi:hypothetical protein
LLGSLENSKNDKGFVVVVVPASTIAKTGAVVKSASVNILSNLQMLFILLPSFSKRLLVLLTTPSSTGLTFGKGKTP